MTSLEIRATSAEFLAARGIPLHPHLPPPEFKRFRRAPAVAERLVALYAVAGLGNGADGSAIAEWLEEEGLSANLSANEARLLSDAASGSLEEQDEIDASWRTESLFALSWALNIVRDELPFPGQVADLELVFPSIPPEVDPTEFINSAACRGEDELRLALDQYYCLHAAIAHAELWPTNHPGGLNESVVRERRHALEWLLDCDEEWDDISLDT